jgi:hypothetical protein
MLVHFESIRAIALLNGGLVELYFLSDEFAPWTDLKTDLQSTALDEPPERQDTVSPLT